jgi:hypothetical protein
MNNDKNKSTQHSVYSMAHSYCNILLGYVITGMKYGTWQNQYVGEIEKMESTRTFLSQ